MDKSISEWAKCLTYHQMEEICNQWQLIHQLGARRPLMINGIGIKIVQKGLNNLICRSIRQPWLQDDWTRITLQIRRWSKKMGLLPQVMLPGLSLAHRSRSSSKHKRSCRWPRLRQIIRGLKKRLSTNFQSHTAPKWTKWKSQLSMNHRKPTPRTSYTNQLNSSSLSKLIITIRLSKTKYVSKLHLWMWM